MNRPQRRLGGIRRWAALAVALLVAMGALAACSSDSDEADDTDASGGQADGEAITIGWIPWDEDVAATQLWKRILEDKGYEVELTQLDVAPVYSGMANGDIDVFLDGWLPTTHSDYWDQFGPDLEDIGVWYDSATLNIAVPEYVDATTIADLQGNAGNFDDQIVGIEPGAGLMRITRDEVIPTYGLDDYTLVEGSTPAMLAELERALDNEEPIVVTLWHPHWAYSAYDIKDLEDPENALGDAEQIHVLAKDGFSSEFPEVAEWLASFEMTDAQLGALEDLVLNQYETGQEQEAVDEWLQDPANQELVDSWTQT